jgi:hypothetical protein
MATGGLYGSSTANISVASSGAESNGLYGNNTNFGGTYFEWFIFQVAASQPATPTGGSWDFTTNVGTAPTGWLNAPISNPTNPVWVSIGLVNSRSTSSITWSTPGVFSYSGQLNGSAAPTSGTGLDGEFYIQTGVSPYAIWFKNSGTWVQVTGAALYVALTGDQTIGGTKTFSNVIQGSISGNAATATNATYATSAGSVPYSGLTGTVPTWNQNTTGTAANITATSNNTLTTLSALSLPYSQLSGTVPTWNQNTTGNAATVTNGVYTTGSYPDPSWITSLATTKLSGTVTNAQLANSAITINSTPVSLGGSITIPSSMVYPGAGIPNSTGTAWGTSYTTTGTGSTVALATAPTLNNPTISNYQAFTSGSAPSYAEGLMWYDSTAHALAYYNDSSNDIVHLGQDLLLKVINNTGSTIANGSPVYITGTSSGQTYPNIALAKADVAATSAVIGLTNGSIANGAIGYVTAQGGIDNVNTGTFTVGQVLYLSPYSAGQLMNTIPPTGITVQVGVVSYVNSSTGKIYVKQTTPLNVPASIISGQVAIANGGTGQSTANAAFNALAPSQTGNSGKYLTTDGSNTSWAVNPLGTVTSVATAGTVNGLTLTGGPITTSGTITLGGTLDLSSPPAIGGTTPAAGTFTTLSATTGIDNTVIGGTTPAAGTFTTLTATGQTSLGGAAGSESFRATVVASQNRYVNAQGGVSGVTYPAIGTGGGGEAFGVYSNLNVIRFTTNGYNNTTQAVIAHTASAVNYVQVTGAATGIRPAFSAQGSDANIGLNYVSKGTGSHRFDTRGGSGLSFIVADNGGGASANTNYIQVTGALTTLSPIVSAQGSDTNISQVFQSKGTGAIDLAAGSSGVNISNGGTVTAITVTANGGSYTSAPTWSATAPTTAGGVQATGTTVVGASAALTINGGGTGYTAGDLLTVVGGTNTQAAVITVGTVSAGVITSATVTTFGQYSVVPTSPVSVTGGTGSGATFTLTYFVRSCAIGNAGSGYVEQPTVSFSGGGGSGAAAYATVGSTPKIQTLGTNLDFYTPGGVGFRVGDNGTTTAGYWAAYGGVTAPVLRAITTASGIFQTNGAYPLLFQTNFATQQFAITHTASAVNYVQVTGSVTNQSASALPTISIQGSDATTYMGIGVKGTSGYIAFYNQNASSNQTFRISSANGGSTGNLIQVNAAAAGSAPSIQAISGPSGTDTNIDLTLTPKGTGVVQFGAYTAGVLTPTGYITIKDSGGTTRRLLVG